MSVDEALKYIISMGVVAPGTRRPASADARRRERAKSAGLSARGAFNAPESAQHELVSAPSHITPECPWRNPSCVTSYAGLVSEHADGPDRDPDGLGPSPP